MAKQSSGKKQSGGKGTKNGSAISVKGNTVAVKRQAPAKTTATRAAGIKRTSTSSSAASTRAAARVAAPNGVRLAKKTSAQLVASTPSTSTVTNGKFGELGRNPNNNTVGKIPSATIVPSKVTVTAKAKIVAQVVTQVVAVVEHEEEFKVHDKVVYPAHGVGVIDAVQIRRVSNSEQKFYTLTILDTGMKIMVPVGQAKVVGLRRIVDSKTVDKVYEILKDRKTSIDTQTWNRRYREYTQKIKTGSVFEIAKVIRDLAVLKGDKELSFGERKMLDTAQGLLVKEISIAKASPEEMIKAELSELFDAAF